MPFPAPCSNRPERQGDLPGRDTDPSLERLRIYLCGVRLAFGLSRPMPGYPTTPAWYPVPVRQLRVLPPASSPPHLAVTQLPLANGSGQPARRGLAPPRSAPCLAHMGSKGLLALGGSRAEARSGEDTAALPSP